MNKKTSEIIVKTILFGLLLVSCKGLEFTIEPSDIVVPEGTSVALNCAGRLNETTSKQDKQPSTTKEGKTAPNIRWRGPDGQDIGIVGDTFRNQLTNGSLYISAVDENKGLTGSYQCLLSADGVGTVVSRSARVTIVKIPEVNQDSHEIYLSRGQTAYLKCTLGPLPGTTATVQWFKDDSPLRPDHSRMTFLQSGALEIDELTETDQGTYQCNITSGTFSKQSSKSNLNIKSPSGLPEKFVAPTFATTPQTQVTREGQTITLDCVANGNPKPQIHWLKNGVEIDFNDLDSRYAMIGTGSLQITAVQDTDSGDYQCRAMNSEDSLDAVATVQVQVPPKFVQRPTNKVAYEKDELEFSCSIVGKPTPVIHWLKNGDLITPNDYMQIVGGHNLRILGLISSDAGMFQCIGTNNAGSVQASARLQILETVVRKKQKTPKLSKKHKKLLDSGEKYQKQRILSKSVLESLRSNDKLRQVSIGDESFLESNDEENNYDDADDENYDEDDDESQSSAIHRFGFDPKVVFNSLTEQDDTTILSFNSNIPVTRKHQQQSNHVVNKGGPLAPLPGEPRDVKAEIIKPRFVTLSWQEPYKNADEIISYSVFYKLSTSERERKKSTPSRTEQELNIQNLSPGKIYQFRVVANSNNGYGDTSETAEIATLPEENIAGPPQNVRARAISHTEIEIEWDPPLITNGIISKYRIYYAETDSGSELDEDSTGTRAILGRLRPYTEYAISVVPWNQNGMGDSSTELLVRTFSAVPSEAPQNVSLETTGATSIMIRWEPPPTEDRNGQITGYKIRYKKAKNKVEYETTPGNARQWELKNLERMSAYQVKIAAMNVNGTGPTSEWFHAETYESDLDESQVPGKPAFIRTQPSAESVRVSWGPPERQEVKVRGYILGWGKGIPDEEVITVDEKTRYHEILKLEPNSEYVISLRARNNQGDGIPVYDTVRTREEIVVEMPTPLEVPVGLRAIPHSGTSIVVYWTDTTLSKSQVVTDNRYYVVSYTANGSHRPRYHNTTQHNCMISDLRPNTQYEFAVKVVKGRRESPWSMSVLNTTLQATPVSPPRDLNVKPELHDASTVILTWLPPKYSVAPITGYIVYYTTDRDKRDRDWMQETVIGDKTMAIIRNLDPRTLYYFKVQTRNAKGVGQFSAMVEREVIPLMQARDTVSVIQANFPIIALSLTCLTLAIIISISCYACRNKKPESPKHPKQTYEKTTCGIKPPDLWIHHDQMELKNMEKNPNTTTPGSEILPSSGAMTLPRNVHHDYDSQSTLSHITNSLDKRNYVPAYMTGGAGGKADVGELMNIYNQGVFAAGTVINSPMERPAYTQRSQYTLSRPPQISLDSTLSQQNLMQQPGSLAQTPENPYNYDTLPSNYNPNVTYAPGLSVDAPKRGPSSLKSFAMNGANGTPINVPTVTIRPQNVSPYKKSSSALTNSLTLSNRLQTGPLVAHSSDEIQRLHPSNSTEELNQEMANLDCLMKDLSAITASEFEC